MSNPRIGYCRIAQPTGTSVKYRIGGFDILIAEVVEEGRHVFYAILVVDNRLVRFNALSYIGSCCGKAEATQECYYDGMLSFSHDINIIMYNQKQ